MHLQKSNKLNEFNIKAKATKMKKILFIIILVSGSFINAQNKNEFPVLKGDYLGQIPPDSTPLVFARGIISDNYQQHSVPSFSPDGNEVLWQTNRRPETEDGKWLTYSMTMKRTGGIWAAPEITPYSSMPFFSTDGNRIYFDDNENGLVFVEKQGNSWSEPKSIGLVQRFPELKKAFFPSLTSNGTIYFMGYTEEQWNNFGLYRSSLVNGKYEKPELLPPGINAPGSMRNWVPFIAPDESYLIFCSTRGLPNNDQGDLFVSFRQHDGSWTEPVTLGSPINTNQMERFSALSPDGRYLFFTRDTPGYDEDVYWVSAEIIGRIKKKVLGK